MLCHVQGGQLNGFLSKNSSGFKDGGPGHRSWGAALQFIDELRRNSQQVAGTSCTKCIGACQQSWRHAIQLLEHSESTQLQRNIVTLTSCIQACKRDQWKCAALVRSQLRHEGLEQDVVVVTAASAATAGSSKWQAVVKTVLQLEAVGIQADANICGLAISTCAKVSEWRTAVALLLAMRGFLEADEVAVSATIGACQNAAEWQQAMCLLSDIATRKLRPTVISFCSSMSACVNAGTCQWEKAIVLKMLLSCGGLQSNVIAFNSVAHAVQWPCASRMLAELSSNRGCDVITINAASNACARAANWQQSLYFLRHIVAMQVQRDATTVSTCQSACHTAQLWWQALSCFNEFEVYSLRRTEVSYSMAIRACGQFEHGGWQKALDLGHLEPGCLQVAEACARGAWDVALVLLAQSDGGAGFAASLTGSPWRLALNFLREAANVLVPNAISLGTTVKACSGAGQWREAVVLFSSMRPCGLRREAICSNTNTFTRGQWRWALHMLHGTAPNHLAISTLRGPSSWAAALSSSRAGMETKANAVLSFNALTTVAQRCARWQLAFCLSQSLLQRSLQASLFACSAAMSACEQVQEWQRAVLALYELESEGPEPDVVAFNTAISSCEKASEWALALCILGCITSLSIRTTVASYNAAISACEKAEKSQQALKLLQKLVESSLLPDVITYNAAMSACGRAGRWCRALELLITLCKKLQPSFASYGAATSACASASKWKHALGLLQEATARSLSTTKVLSAAVSSCRGAQQWQWALWLFRDGSACPDVITHVLAISACETGDCQQVAAPLLTELTSITCDQLHLQVLRGIETSLAENEATP